MVNVETAKEFRKNRKNNVYWDTFEKYGGGLDGRARGSARAIPLAQSLYQG